MIDIFWLLLYLGISLVFNLFQWWYHTGFRNQVEAQLKLDAALNRKAHYR